VSTFISKHVGEMPDFPDGQPHIRVYEFDPVVVCRITTPRDLFNVVMLAAIYDKARKPLQLEILYLMGARMDRALSDHEPYTLDAVCHVINVLPLNRVSVFCPHSQAVSDLLYGYTPVPQVVEDSFYSAAIMHGLASLRLLEAASPADIRQESRDYPISFVYPDLGAQKRMSKSDLLMWHANANTVVMMKDRDERTGRINGIQIVAGKPQKVCVIVDDLCDGGATFVGAAKCLRQAGAESVILAVPHGVFSKGIPLEGIDFIATTNSFCDRESIPGQLHVQNFV